MIDRLAISGYRSLRDLTVSLDRLNVVTGANGAGKSSLYRALRLLAEAAQGRVVQSLAADGGLPSALWAGPEAFSREVKAGRYPVQGTVRRGPVSLKLGFGGEDYGYAIDLGLPIPSTTLFGQDPQIKAEALWTGPRIARSNIFAERKGPLARVRDKAGRWLEMRHDLAHYDSMLTEIADPHQAAELLVLRERMRRWRFYDHLRTDREAPARRPQVGTRTPILAGDGADFAAALQTIIETDGRIDLDAAIEDAFPGSELEVVASDGLFEATLRQHGLLRPLKAAELSDGTLRFLLLVAALLSPRPPELMVLNEPETSLHPDLLPALARLIAEAATRSQVIVVSHSAALVEALPRHARRIVLEKSFGETRLAEGDDAAWSWPGR